MAQDQGTGEEDMEEGEEVEHNNDEEEFGLEAKKYYN